jgi:hypothetical protein
MTITVTTVVAATLHDGWQTILDNVGRHVQSKTSR